MSDGSAVDADHAIELQDMQISRVVYHEVTKQAPQVWITFEVDQPQELFLQIGVPVLDRLRKYRPALALLGPGLPDVRLPFEFLRSEAFGLGSSLIPNPCPYALFYRNGQRTIDDGHGAFTLHTFRR